MRTHRKSFVLGLLVIVISLVVHIPVSAQSQPPEFSEIDIPASISAGDAIEILVRVKNTGSQVDVGYITISFPDASSGMVFTPLTSEAEIIKPGTPIIQNVPSAGSSYSTMTARDPMIEAKFLGWESGEEHELRLRVENTAGATQLTNCIRATFRYDNETGVQYLHAPSGGVQIDQQEFPVELYTTSIGVLDDAMSKNPDRDRSRTLCIAFLIIALLCVLFACLPSTASFAKKNLQNAVYQHFGGNLEPLYIALHVNPAAVSGKSEQEKAVYLVNYLYRRDKIKDLIAECSARVPNQGWSKYKTLSPQHSNDLEDTLDKRFDEKDLRELCIEAQIDYDTKLEGSTPKEKLAALMAYCYRHDCFDRLIAAGDRLRGDIRWHLVKFTRPKDESDPVKVFLDRCNEDELQDLCLGFGIDYQILKGNTLRERAQDLVNILTSQKVGKHKIVTVGSSLRSDINWKIIHI